jgi:hypothetical protein
LATKVLKLEPLKVATTPGAKRVSRCASVEDPSA